MIWPLEITECDDNCIERHNCGAERLEAFNKLANPMVKLLQQLNSADSDEAHGFNPSLAAKPFGYVRDALICVIELQLGLDGRTIFDDWVENSLLEENEFHRVIRKHLMN